jgi:hypothetical protein
MTATITTKATKIMRSTRLKRAAAAIIGHETSNTLPAVQKSFLTWCAAPLGEVSLATAISALYYLPQNFMLMIPRTVSKDTKLSAMIAGASIKNQIQFYDEKDSSKEDGSFSLADAVIGGETDTSLAVMPSTRYSELAAKDFSFAVGRSPEAVASALLNIARDEA